MYFLKAARIVTASVLLLSGCKLSIRSAHTETAVSASCTGADTTPPALASGMSFSQPSGGGASAYSTAIIGGTTGADAGSSCGGTQLTLKFYLNDAACGSVNLVGSTTAAPGSAFSVTTSSLAAGGDGTKAFHYTVEDSSGNISACTSAGLSYTYQAVPKISFTRMGYSIKEDGSQVGTAVSVQRDVCGVASGVTVSTSNVTAVSGTHYTSGAIPVTFAASDCTSKTISAAAFAIADDATTTGDLYFKATLGSFTGSVAAADLQIAQVNILDSAMTGTYTFSQPLYTAAAGETSVSLYVQRTSTAGAGSVQVAFDDGSAVTATDFDGTTQLVSFAAGESEKTVTVPIIPRTYNASFVARLINPAANAGTRNLGVAKVRIMNAAASTCNPSGAPFGDGTGAPGTPFLICTLTQFKQISTSLSSSFKITADIVGDGTIVPQGVLTGNFDGDEHILYNFEYAGAATKIALFTDATGGSYVRNFNMLHVNVSNNNTRTAGLIAVLGGAAIQPAVSSILVSGLVTSNNTETAMVIGSVQSGTTGAQVNDLSKLLSFGRVVTGAGSASAGTVGWIAHNAGAVSYTVTLDRLYNGANVQTTGGDIGGVMGRVTIRGTATLSNFDNRGYVVGATSVGGSYGEIASGVTDLIVNATSMHNGGTIAGTTEVGGIGGRHNGVGTSTFTGISNDGPVSNAGNRTGGIIGDVILSANTQTFSMTNSTNAGTVTGATQVGGILGRINYTGAISGNTATVSNCTNTGTISGTGVLAGILAYIWFDNTAGTSTATLTGNTNSANVTASAVSARSGGILGELATRIESDQQVTLTSNNNSGNISCAGGDDCGGVVGRFLVRSTKASLIDQAVNTGTVTSATGDSMGGLVGFLGLMDGVSTVTVSNSSSTGNVTVTASASGQVGGLIGYFNNYYGNFLLDHSYSSGVLSNNVQDTGGLIGLMDIDQAAASSKIRKSYSTATVTGGTNYSGGLVGRLSMSSAASVFDLEDSYSEGAVTGQNYVAGLVGSLTDGSAGFCTVNFLRNYSRSSIAASVSAPGGLYAQNTNCTANTTATYWRRDTGFNDGFASDANARDTYDLTNLAGQTLPTYTGWDFTVAGPWNTFVPGSYPTLR